VGVVLFAARFIVALIFLRAGTAKLADRFDFRAAVANYRILPSSLTGPVAAILPWAEIAVGTLLTVGMLTSPAAAVLALLLAAFSVAIAINLARGREFACGCTGTAPSMISWRHVAVNAVLAVAAIAVALAPPTALAVWPGVPAAFQVGMPAADAVPVLLTVILGFALAAVLRAVGRILNLLGGQLVRAADSHPRSL
jgi:Methylamine utilisation protein MauE